VSGVQTCALPISDAGAPALVASAVDALLGIALCGFSGASGPATTTSRDTVDDVPTLYATSDLHVTHTGNETHVDVIRPDTPDDWLLVAGDVGERMSSVVDTLARLRERFATVVWVPGNHELWTTAKEPDALSGAARYEEFVRRCRDIGVLTPEDEFPVWPYADRPLTIAPLFVLYDYTWRTPAATGVPV